MVKKRIIFIALLLVGVLSFTAACNDNNNEHIHEFSSQWNKDRYGHWKECECGLENNLESHNYLDGICTICNYASSDGLEYVLLSDDTYEVADIGECLEYDIVIPNVYKGKSVTSIGSSAFSGCSSLTNVYYAGITTDWSNITIGSNNENLTSATIYYYSETKPTDTTINIGIIMIIMKL